MPATYETDLYRRLKAEVDKIRIIDTHEHLQRESELPQGDACHIGRFFLHYASTDLVSAGMAPQDLQTVRSDASLSPKDRWKLIEPWYRKSWNTAYCEALRIAVRDVYDIDDFSTDTVDELTDRMRARIRPGLTRELFDMAGIGFAMNNPFGPKPVFNPDFGTDCFVCDMIMDWFTAPEIAALKKDSGMAIESLDDYLKVIDWYFERDARAAGGGKFGIAYGRKLEFPERTKEEAAAALATFLSDSVTATADDKRVLEDYLVHYVAGKCGEYDLRLKFHTGLQEGNRNNITNSRAVLLINLFAKYPGTKFDMYHISYPYEGELTAACHNYANMTIDFCWMWIINPAAGRRALSEMLDVVPASKIHGFGGDYIFVEGTYAHAKIARREITRVLCEKVEEGRYSEDYALEVARMLLRENAIENFGLMERREAFKARAAQKQ